MQIPLVVLAVLSIVGGFVELPRLRWRTSSARRLPAARRKSRRGALSEPSSGDRRRAGLRRRAAASPTAVLPAPPRAGRRRGSRGLAGALHRLLVGRLGLRLALRPPLRAARRVAGPRRTRPTSSTPFYNGAGAGSRAACTGAASARPQTGRVRWYAAGHRRRRRAGPGDRGAAMILALAHRHPAGRRRAGVARRAAGAPPAARWIALAAIAARSRARPRRCGSAPSAPSTASGALDGSRCRLGLDPAVRHPLPPRHGRPQPAAGAAHGLPRRRSPCWPPGREITEARRASSTSTCCGSWPASPASSWRWTCSCSTSSGN